MKRNHQKMLDHLLGSTLTQKYPPMGFASKVFRVNAQFRSFSPRSGGLNLARPFKAGNELHRQMRVASATLEYANFIRRSRDAVSVSLLNRALKDPAKFRPPLRGEGQTFRSAEVLGQGAGD